MGLGQRLEIARGAGGRPLTLPRTCTCARHGHLDALRWFAAMAPAPPLDFDMLVACAASMGGHAAVLAAFFGPGAGRAVAALQDKKRSTPLMYAAEQGHFAVSQWLHAHGVPIDVVDDLGSTALLCVRPHKQACADGPARSRHRWRCPFLSLSRARQGLPRLAVAACRWCSGCTPRAPRWRAVTSSATPPRYVPRWAVRHGDAGVAGVAGLTCWPGPRTGNLPVLQWLVEIGCSVRDRNHDGSTCVLWAAFKGPLAAVPPRCADRHQ